MFDDTDATAVSVLYGDRSIQRVTKFKYLGFVLDAKLTWSLHIDAVVSKVKQRLHCLRRSRYIVSRGGRFMLYNALIMPYLSYGIELWFASSRAARGTAELLQRHCLRIVMNDIGPIPALTNVCLYVSLDVLPLSLLFQQKLGLMMYKVLKRDACPLVRQLLMNHSEDHDSSNASLRTRDPFRVPLTRLESCRARLAFYGCRLWNHLRPSFRDACSESSFVLLYRAYLMEWLIAGTGEPCPTKFYDYI